MAVSRKNALALLAATGIIPSSGETQNAQRTQRRSRLGFCFRLVWLGLAATIALLALVPSAGAANSSELRRYPYLTDVVGDSATINWGTTRFSITGVVRYGEVGTESCTAHTVTPTKTAITVNGVAQYQWKARLTLSPNTEYCYRLYLGTSLQIDLLGDDPSPHFKTQLPYGSNEPYSFAVFGDWGYVAPDGRNPDQANLMRTLASSGARFALTTGDNAYPSGSQTNYGDLVQTGLDTSGVFGPDFWTVPGRSIPLFPAMGNHGFSGATSHFTNWPEDTAAAESGGRYLRETYCCLNGTTSAQYPSAWYAFDAGKARFYVLEAAWTSTNVGTSDEYGNDYDYHWAPTSEQYRWLQNDLATHPRALKFAFFHYPLNSDNASETSDPLLRGPNSLEGLLNRYGVDIAFNGHAHMYQRNLASGPLGLPSYITGGGGATLQPIGAKGCTALDAYGIGWSYTANGGLGGGTACGAATAPTEIAQVFHFLLVNVTDSGVTVTPTDEQGRPFDVMTYPRSSANADLSVTTSDSADPAANGHSLTYTMSVHNDGPSDAGGVVLTDNLPSGADYESATPSQGSCDQTAGVVTCSLGSLASGASATVDVKVKPQNIGTITNKASIVADDLNDSNTANNSDSEDTSVQEGADLSLTKSDSADPVVVGRSLTYSIDVRNGGTADATGVTVTDDLPAGTTFESATPSQGSCSEAGGTVTCELAGLANGASATIEVKVTPQNAGTITNTARVRGDQPDPDSANNSDSEDTSVVHEADLSITKSDTPDPVFAGQTLTYTLLVANGGPEEASGVTVTDQLPSGTTFSSATPSQGSCSEASGTVTCQLGSIANGATASVELKVTPQAAGTITNTAGVASTDSIDPSAVNDSDSEDTIVSPAADIAITQSDSPDPVLAGQLLTYMVSAKNNGPSDATGVNVSDTLPANAAYVSAVPSQGSCSAPLLSALTCNLGSLAQGSTATVQITVRPQDGGTITNLASVLSDQADLVPANNSASESTAVTPVADVSILKSESVDPAFVGKTFVYTLSVANAGPSTATGVTTTDKLPSLVTYQSATASQGSCSFSAGVVTCALGSIASGGSATVNITVKASKAGSATNTASVTAGPTDPNPANNSATVKTAIKKK